MPFIIITRCLAGLDCDGFLTLAVRLAYGYYVLVFQALNCGVYFALLLGMVSSLSYPYDYYTPTVTFSPQSIIIPQQNGNRNLFVSSRNKLLSHLPRYTKFDD